MWEILRSSANPFPENRLLGKEVHVQGMWLMRDEAKSVKALTPKP